MNKFCTQIWIMLSFLTISAFSFQSLNAQAPQPEDKTQEKVFYFKLNDNIFPSALRKVQQAFDQAEEAGATTVIMQLNTYGGMVDIADSIATRILNAEPRTVVLIDNNAASAGALISLACDSIYMVKGARIGAATVVSGTDGKQAPDKYQSYMRATMRGIAETQGRDPLIAEAMVDDRVVIPGIIDSGRTLTFTTTEAIKHNFADGEMSNLEEVIKELDLQEAELKSYQGSSYDKLIDFLLDPKISGFLMMIIFAGIYFEIQSPGIGLPLLASLTAATLYFMPNYIEGLAQNWEILLFVIGLILVAVEIFVLPGFGVAGVSGVALIVGGLALSMINNQLFDFTFSAPGEVTTAFGTTVVAMAASLLLLFLFGGSLLNSPAMKRMVLEEAQTTSEGYSIEESSYHQMVGSEGITATDLKISGKIIIDNKQFEAISEGSFIDKGTPVKVIEYKGAYLVVRKVNSSLA